MKLDGIWTGRKIWRGTKCEEDIFSNADDMDENNELESEREASNVLNIYINNFVKE